MVPHSYALDAHSKAQDLASAILSSSSASQIASACFSVESYLRSHSGDHSRHFFSVTFPSFICKLFGFCDAVSSQAKPQPPSGWIEAIAASNDSDLANKVFALLAPSGVLFQVISAVDRQSLVKYVFPIERLPEWARFLLSSEKDCGVLSELCSLFRDRVKEDSVKGSPCQIQLNVFEYYIFWFAYYPVCRGKNESSDSVSVKKSRRFKLESWASSIPRFSGTKRRSEQKPECNLYVRLLYAYLRAFVPTDDFNAHQPCRNALLHYSSVFDGSVLAKGEFLVNTLVHFWLVDNDFSPLPVSVVKTYLVSFPFRSVLGETPPASGLGEVVKLMMKYLNLGTFYQSVMSESVGHCGTPRWRDSVLFDAAKLREATLGFPSVPSNGYWNSCMQRPLYRFILRTFLFCPMGSSMKNVYEVFSVWIGYMEPWKINSEAFSELDSVVDRPAKNEGKEELLSQRRGYSPAWQGYVLSNYLYYSSLVMHFIGFAHKFLHTDVETIVQMVLKVLTILTSSEELIVLIRNVDTAYHSRQAGSSKEILNSLRRFVPSIREQLQDWEDGLCESEADGSFLHENWNKDLRLFGNNEDGGKQLLQLFILRAEAELQATASNNLSQGLEYIDSLKSKVSCLIGSQIVKELSFTPVAKQHQEQREGIFKPRRFGNQVLADIKYKGDWMKRPIAEDEVAWLAKLLVRLSDWLNDGLGLNEQETNGARPTWSYIEVPSDICTVNGPAEAVKTVSYSVASWLRMLGATVVGLMRKNGMRINLRVLSSKKVVMVLLFFVVFSVVKQTFSLFQRV